MDNVIIFCANYLFVVVALCLVGLWLLMDNENKKKYFIATLFAGIVAFILSRIASHLYYDPRPFVAHHVKPLIPHAPDNGFPSDHALLTMTLTAITYYFNRKVAGIMLILTIIVGVARVLARVHSPLDIAGGWVFGIIGSICGYYLMKVIFRKYLASKQTAK